MSKEPMSKDQWAKDFAKALQEQVSQYNSPSNAVSMARGAADMQERQREAAPVNLEEERLKLKIEGLEDKLRAAEDECRQAKEHRGCTLKSWDLSVQRNIELIADRDELKTKLEANEKESLQRYENLFAEYQSVKADRDGLLNSLNKTTGALNKLSREHKDALVNHDSIKADHEVIKSDRDHLLGVLSNLRGDYSKLMTRNDHLRYECNRLKNELKFVAPTDGVATEETKGETVTVQGELIAQSLSGVQIRLPSGSCLYVAKEDLTPENK